MRFRPFKQSLCSLALALAVCLAGGGSGVEAQELALGPSEVGLVNEIGLAVPALAVGDERPQNTLVSLNGHRPARRVRGGGAVQGWEAPVESGANSAEKLRALPLAPPRRSGLSRPEPGDKHFGGEAGLEEEDGVRRFSAYPVPWVEATGWEKARLPYGDSPFERSFELEDWALFRGDIAVDTPPSFVGAFRSRAPFHVSKPPGNRISRKLKRVARKKAYQEIRRAVKRRWRKQYRASTMSYGQYRAQMERIRNIGRDPDEVDPFDDDFTTSEVREDLFQDGYRDGERELPLLTWGPITVTDAGSMYFDLGGVDTDPETIELGQEREERNPFLATKDYRIDTRFQFDVKPDRLFQSDVLEFVRSYGITVEIDWLSDVLGKETLSAELQLEVDDHSDVAGFFNFVIKSR